MKMDKSRSLNRKNPRSAAIVFYIVHELYKGSNSREANMAYKKWTEKQGLRAESSGSFRFELFVEFVSGDRVNLRSERPFI